MMLDRQYNVYHITHKKSHGIKAVILMPDRKIRYIFGADDT